MKEDPAARREERHCSPDFCSYFHRWNWEQLLTWSMPRYGRPMLGLHAPSCWNLPNCECPMQYNKQKFLRPWFDLFVKHVKSTSAVYKEHLFCPSRLWCITLVRCLQHWPMRLGMRKMPLHHYKPRTLILGSLSELHFLCFLMWIEHFTMELGGSILNYSQCIWSVLLEVCRISKTWLLAQEIPEIHNYPSNSANFPKLFFPSLLPYSLQLASSSVKIW